MSFRSCGLLLVMIINHHFLALQISGSFIPQRQFLQFLFDALWNRIVQFLLQLLANAAEAYLRRQIFQQLPPSIQGFIPIGRFWCWRTERACHSLDGVDVVDNRVHFASAQADKVFHVPILMDIGAVGD